MRGEREGEEGGTRAVEGVPPRAGHRVEGGERSAAMVGGTIALCILIYEI